MVSTGKKLVYTAVMPTTIRGFLKMQTGNNMNKLLKHISWMGRKEGTFRECHVTMPKFKLNFDYDFLKDHLVDLGILSFNIKILIKYSYR